MKIAFVYDLIYPYSMGGVEKRIADLAPRLAKRGHEVHVFGTLAWDGPASKRVAGVELRGIEVRAPIHTRRGLRSVWQALRFSVALMRRVARERFDVIDVQSMAPITALITLIIGRAKRIPVLVTWHEVWKGYWIEYMGLSGVMGWLTERLLARLATAHVAVSERTAGKLKSLGLEDVSVLRNGIDLSVFKPTDRTFDTPRIVHVGRLVPHKNLELLIDSARLMRDRGLLPQIEIAGDGPHREALQDRASGLGHVKFVGSLESACDVAAFVRSATVFVLPSLREGFGISVLEALACGVPVLTVDHPANAAADLVVSGLNGLVTPPDVESFTEALTTMVTDNAARTALASQARFGVQSYDWDLLVGQYEQVYAGLLAEQNPEGSALLGAGARQP